MPIGGTEPLDAPTARTVVQPYAAGSAACVGGGFVVAAPARLFWLQRPAQFCLGSLLLGGTAVAPAPSIRSCAATTPTDERVRAGQNDLIDPLGVPTCVD